MDILGNNIHFRYLKTFSGKFDFLGKYQNPIVLFVERSPWG